MNFKTITIKPAWRPEFKGQEDYPDEIKVKSKKGLCILKRINPGIWGKWSVTHCKTGMNVIESYRKIIAIKALEKLLKYSDWEFENLESLPDLERKKIVEAKEKVKEWLCKQEKDLFA